VEESHVIEKSGQKESQQNHQSSSPVMRKDCPRILKGRALLANFFACNDPVQGISDVLQRLRLSPKDGISHGRDLS
jgi:hypothetical protein